MLNSLNKLYLFIFSFGLIRQGMSCYQTMKKKKNSLKIYNYIIIKTVK